MPLAFAGPYSINAFSLTDEKGKPLLTNRDIECVSFGKSPEGKPSVNFLLNSNSSRFFYDYTSKNIGSKVKASICGVAHGVTPIQEVVAGGHFIIDPLTEKQIQCLKDSFVISEKCKECPACKN